MRRLLLPLLLFLLACPAWAQNEINFTGYSVAQTQWTTALNALADTENELGAAITNTDGETHLDLELFVNTQGSARSADAVVLIYLLASVDGTNYPTGADGAGQDPNQSPSCIMKLDAATTARYEACRGLAVPPNLFKVLLANETGQAFAGTGNTLDIKWYSLEVN